MATKAEMVLINAVDKLADAVQRLSVSHQTLLGIDVTAEELPDDLTEAIEELAGEGEPDEVEKEEVKPEVNPIAPTPKPEPEPTPEPEPELQPEVKAPAPLVQEEVKPDFPDEPTPEPETSVMEEEAVAEETPEPEPGPDTVEDVPY
jgi:hypothetical protein